MFLSSPACTPAVFVFVFYSVKYASMKVATEHKASFVKDITIFEASIKEVVRKHPQACWKQTFEFVSK